MNSTAPTSAPAIRPMARLIAPSPASASAIDSDRAHPGDVHLIDQHAPTGCELPLEERGGRGDDAVDHDADREQADDVRGGRERRSQLQNTGASAKVAAARSALAPTESSSRSARSRAARPGQRTIARLTPSSLKLSTASERHRGDGERAELLRTEQPRERDADRQRPEATQHGAQHVKPERAPGPPEQCLIVGHTITTPGCSRSDVSGP